MANIATKEARWVDIGLFVLVGQLSVFGGTAAAQSDACRVGQELGPGESCTIDVPGFRYDRFEVSRDGIACLSGRGQFCSAPVLIWEDFRASRISGTDRWRINALPGGGTNQPPRPTGSIPAQTLTVGGAASSVDVAPYFTDPDGDALTYTASSNRNGIVTAAVAGSTVTLTPAVEDEGGATALWSSALTAAPFESETTTRFMGYMRTEGDDGVRQRGELSDPDFDFRGTAHHVPFLAQNRQHGTIVLRIGPRLDEQDVNSMTLTVDGHALAVSDASLFPESIFGGMPVLSIVWNDPGFRWSDGQRIAVQLTTGQDGGGVSGTTVTLTPVAGTATVTVTARDPGGLSATQTIAVTVQAAGGVNGFTDDPLVPGATPVRAVHFQELRTRIDALRTRSGLSAYAWTDPALRAGVTGVRSVYLTELRTALNQAFTAAGQSPPVYTDASVRPGTTPVRAAHITQLRAAVVELENAAPTGMMPDLVVGSPTVSNSTLTPGQSFTLLVTVRNRGSARAGATTLRYYRSTTSTISTSDTEVGTDAVSALAAGASGAESISLTAPDTAGTYYYGACVEAVSGESDTGNNCSAGVRVTVESGGGGDAVRVRITRCTGSLIAPGLATVSLGGTVRALRSVTSVVVTGTVNGAFLGVHHLGSIAAGNSKDFGMSGIVPVSGTRIRCEARIEYRVTGAGAERRGVTGTSTLDEALR